MNTELDPNAYTPPTLGSVFRRHSREYMLGGLMLGAFQLGMNRVDWLSKTAIDRLTGPTPANAWEPAVLMLALAVLAFVVRVASRWFLFNAGRDVEFELRETLLARLHKLGTAFYRKMSAGEIMSRSTSDLQQVRLLYGFGVLNVINVIFAFASALQIMLSVSGRLTLACLANLPLVVLMTRGLGKGLYKRMRENQSTLAGLTDVVQANLAGVRVIRSFALRTRERERFDVANTQYLDASLALARLRGSLGPLVGAISATGTLVFFWYGASLLLRGPANGGITQGAFFAFWSALARMAWPMMALGFVVSILQRGKASFARITEILEAKPEVTDGTRPAPRHINGSLHVSNLAFSYGDRKVLDDVSFELRAGGSLAIVGKTGAGKSTLAMLLARLLPTPASSVRIDGNDVCELPVSTVRTAVGYAQQDAFLFSTTVARNIGLSVDDPESVAGDAQIRQAAREAQVYDEVMELPEQFDTVVGERGVQLSGGQKQRVALARALIWEPKILVLDDPLSAVDAKTEAAILEALDRQAAKRTLVLITHRVAAAARCETIIVLDRGKIVERGTHDELVRNGGLYAAFAEEQKMASELEEIDVAVAEAS